MFERIKNHVFTLHEKVELLILYGILMFGLGVWLNHLFSPDPHEIAEEMAEEIADEIIQQQVQEAFIPVQVGVEPVVETTEPAKTNIVSSEIIVKKGDNFTKLMVEAGIDRKETFFAGKELSKIYNLRGLKAGRKIIVNFEEVDSPDSKGKHLEFLYLEIEEPDRFVRLTKYGNKKFRTSIKEKLLNRQVSYASGVIETSLARVALSEKVPPNILNEVIRAYSYDVDFQRDIRKGQRFAVIYDGYFNDRGDKVRDGNVLFALLTVRGKDMEIYRFSPTGSEDDWDYYTAEGRSLRRTLLKTPIDGAVVSSPFGVRRHPISGYTRMHRGMDFAAPTGTPFYAAGDGVITRIGRNGGYGNYVRIKHSTEYSTAYGHASRFAKGMKKGRRVKQGQIIAYVGSTGASTGAHLHFEILKNGKQVNPATAKIPPGKKLDKKGIEKFKEQKRAIRRLIEDYAR